MYNIYLDYFKPKTPCFARPMSLEEAKQRLESIGDKDWEVHLYPQLKEYYYIDKYTKPPKGY